MYNDRMPVSRYEIRVCSTCGLRYPLTVGHSFGTRCPACLGETQVVLGREMSAERRNLDREKEEGHLRRTPVQVGKKVAVLLDNIRSAWNVGSILRSADGFGFAHAFLCGITPTADQEAVTKTALGAQDTVPWSYHKDAVRLVQGLKTEAWKLYALEDHPRAVPVQDAPRLMAAAGQAVLIIGNEVTGVDPDLLDLCDRIVSIPMRGEKRSFNVAIAFSIAAYAFQVPG